MYRGPAAPDAPWASMLVVERTFWNPRGKEEFSETSSRTQSAPERLGAPAEQVNPRVAGGRTRYST